MPDTAADVSHPTADVGTIARRNFPNETSSVWSNSFPSRRFNKTPMTTACTQVDTVRESASPVAMLDVGPYAVNTAPTVNTDA
jgi:hypothetical protein